MTKEEAREAIKDAFGNSEYTDELIKTLEQETIPDKPHIKGDYYDGFKNGSRTAKWRCGKLRDEIDLETRVQVKHYTNTDAVIDAVLDVIDKHMINMEDTK